MISFASVPVLICVARLHHQSHAARYTWHDSFSTVRLCGLFLIIHFVLFCRTVMKTTGTHFNQLNRILVTHSFFKYVNTSCNKSLISATITNDEIVENVFLQHVSVTPKSLRTVGFILTVWFSQVYFERKTFRRKLIILDRLVVITVERFRRKVTETNMVKVFLRSPM